MERCEKRKKMAIGNLVELALSVGVYIFILFLPFLTSSTVSPAILFVPLELIVFIWGMVYVLLGIFCLYTFLPQVRRSSDRGAFIERIGLLFILSCILNISWLFAWEYGNLPLSAGIMGLLVIVLAAIYMRLKISAGEASIVENYLVHVPFRIYAGWAVVAALAHAGALLMYFKGDGFGFGPQLWALAAVSLAVVSAVFMLARTSDVWFSAVVAFVLAGVFLNRLLNVTSSRLVTTAAGAGAVMLIGAVLYLLASGLRRSSARTRYKL